MRQDLLLWHLANIYKPAMSGSHGPAARQLGNLVLQAAMGRGREATKPAWMTNPGASIAPGSAAAPAGPQSELTVQEAMAILAAAKSKHKKSKHKKSKDSHKKKSKKEHKGRSKSMKHRRRDSSSGSSSQDD